MARAIGHGEGQAGSAVGKARKIRGVDSTPNDRKKPGHGIHRLTRPSVEEIRCGSCRALLFKAGAAAVQGPLEIKCRRCGTLNNLRPTRPAPERPRASEGEDTRGWKRKT